MTPITLIVDCYDDATPGQVAFCDAFPEFVGHGDDEAEALDDWLEQYDERVLH
jgi:hypothetical protein